MISDLIITPVSDKLFEILGLKKFESILTELTKIKKEPVIAKVLLNNISPATKKFDDLAHFINSSNHFELLSCILRQRADVVHSSAKGLTIAEHDINSKAHKEMKEFADEVKKLMYI
jgi:chromosome partitioning protein